ncbi:MAG: amidohydrolase family protein [Acidobacteria bacterium]|nr:amidohydrolase family protein [Acidobacteriota bacterium]
MGTSSEKSREIPIQQIDVHTDTRDILAHARQQADERNFEDYFIVDIDAHHMETTSWHEIIRYIEDPVIRAQALEYQQFRTGAPPYGLSGDFGLRYQGVGGRIPHTDNRLEKVEEKDVHPDVILTRRAIESLGLDYMVVFPTAMLFLGVHPQPEMEVLLGRAYNRWLAERILPGDKRIKSFMFLPFNDPEASLRTVEEFSEVKGSIGFIITSTRYKPVHHNHYMKVYAALEEREMPLCFHAGYYWQDASMLQMNRFIGMHALSFVICNLVHMTNWVLNGLPERFPRLKIIWMESGLAWLPFLMQRLDHEYMMRTSEAPLLKKPPSEYMREMFFSSQPIETDHPKALELTFEMINAETQLLYSSDWPHWDFDLPSVIFDLPFLSEQARRNILGENARRLFKLDED